MNQGRLLVIGLGNPGAEYGSTRHNLGAQTVESLAQRLGIRLRGGRGPAWTARRELAAGELILARPKTFMNESGVAGARLLRELELRPEEVVVVYDDLDLAQGRIRVRERGRSGGHNGLRSLQAHWRTQAFPRVRIGIGRPPEGMDPIDYVLAQPGPAERELLDRACVRAGDAVLAIQGQGLSWAMTEFNRIPDDDQGGD
ncbi:MAG: aminoacyl-tRNA hydrolase [Candidatus Dormibacteria bacterium]